MGERIHNKLVRDKIPYIIIADGHEPVYRVLDENERATAAFEKVCEEAAELRDSNGDLGEFADVLASFTAAVIAKGFRMEEVTQAAERKAESRGGFDQWLFLEKVIER